MHLDVTTWVAHTSCRRTVIPLPGNRQGHILEDFAEGALALAVLGHRLGLRAEGHVIMGVLVRVRLSSTHA